LAKFSQTSPPVVHMSIFSESGQNLKSDERSTGLAKYIFQGKGQGIQRAKERRSRACSPCR